MTAAGVAASTCAGVLYELVRARRLGRAAERGDVLELEGSIVGRLRYCHPPGGMLRIDGRRLSWLNAPGGIEYPVPLGGLRFVRSRADGAWAVAECVDGDEVVEIRCRAYALRHVRAVLEH